MTTTIVPREGTGTRDWSPPAGEMRASALGACPRSAWESARTPEDERPVEPIGRRVMMHTGHAAEHEYFRILNEEMGGKWTLDLDLDNGYGGICHPDGLDFERRVVAEVKYTSFKSPAPYHLAQISWYMYRMAETTGQVWSGEVHLLDKFGGPPNVCPVPPPTYTEIQRLKAIADGMIADEPPKGICSSQAMSQNVKHYDALGKQPRAGQNMVCPHHAKCFPPPDDGMEV